MSTHQERVAAAVPDNCKVVALLHDAVEDGHVTAEQIDIALPGPEGHAVLLLTRPVDMTYAAYIESIRQASTMTGPTTGLAGRMARTVKLADLRDNLYHRPAGPPPASLRLRYERALTALERDASSRAEEATDA